MKSRALRILPVLLLLFSVSALGKDPKDKPDPKEEKQPTVEVVSTALSQLTSDSARIAITIAITSAKGGTVEKITFGNLKLNDLPLYAAPYTEKFSLKEAQSFELPHPIEVATYFRDLDTTKPLQEAIQSGRVTVSGDALLTVHLNAAEKMFLFEKRATIPVTFKREVPINIPGGLLARLAAVKLLQGADAAAKSFSPTVSKWVPGSQFRRDVGAQYLKNVMFAFSKYTATARDGRVIDMEWSGVALLVAGDKVILPKEAIEPWAFDPDVVVATGSKDLKVDVKSLDLWLWAPNVVRTSTNALKLSQQDFKVTASGDLDSIKIHRSDTKKVQLRRRDTDGDVALLTLAKPFADFAPLRFSTAEGPAWDTAAVVRFRNNQDALPDIVLLPASRDGHRITLGTPIDSHAFGSPLIAPDGVIGMVQDERSALPWPVVTKTVALTSDGGKK